jgi:hypothetical protein
MTLSFRSLLVATAALLAAGDGRAEGLKLDSFEPFSATDTAAEISLVDHQSCDGDCNDACCGPHVGRDFLVCKDRCGGIYFGSELLMIRPFASDSVLAPGTSDADLGYRAAFRTWAGYQSSSGLGGRVRAFVYDHNTVTATSAADVEVRYFDAELTQAVDFRRWNLLLSGGLRQAETNLLTTAPAIGNTVSGFDGVGLTFSGQATRDLNASRTLRMTMGARWSALFGNTKSGTAAVGNPPITFDRDDLVNVLEINIGPQYVRQMRNGATLIFGSGLDAQYWSNGVDSSGAGTDAGTDDLGFIGLSSSLIYMR